MNLPRQVVYCVLGSILSQLSVNYGQGLKNLQGKQILAAAFEEDVTGPKGRVTELRTAADLENARATVSFAMDLWVIVVHKLRFTTKFVLPTAAGDKTSSAALKSLLRSGAAQVAMSPSEFSNESLEGAAISQQLDSTRYKLYIKTPSSTLSVFGLGAVFTPVLWVTVAATAALLAAILVVIEHAGERVGLGTYRRTPADTGQLVLVVVGNFCYQGAITIASDCAGRVVMVTSLTCGWLVYVSFSTLVLTQLTAVTFRTPFDTLQEMSQRGSHRLLIKYEKELVQEIEAIRWNQSHGLHAMWRRLLPDGVSADRVYTDAEGAVRRLCVEEVALLDSNQHLTAAVMQRAGCSATPLRPTYFRTNLGLMMATSFEEKKVIAKTLTRMREVGLVHKWRSHWDRMTGLRQQVVQDAPTPSPVQIDGLLPVIAIWCIGALVSVVILLLELLCKALSEVARKRGRRRRVVSFNLNPPFPFTR